jgi:hypothetical protein
MFAALRDACTARTGRLRLIRPRAEISDKPRGGGGPVNPHSGSESTVGTRESVAQEFLSTTPATGTGALKI